MKLTPIFGTLSTSLLLIFSTGIQAEEGKKGPSTWPQWRGPTRDGLVAGTGWPDSLKGERLKQLWRVELGPSYSGPIVAPDRVFVTETRDKKFEMVRALDRKTGKELWNKDWPGAMQVPFFAGSNGDWIRSTPAYDGERLYVAGMRDVLVCLNARDGSQLWRVDFVDAYKAPLPAFGFVCSPLVDDGAVYVQAGASVVKLDGKTGKQIWRTLKDDGGMNGSAFSSPILADIAGRRQLLVQTREKLVGVGLDTGDVLWSQTVPTFRGMNILTPIVLNDRIFTSAYGGKTFMYDIVKQEDKFKVAETWNNKAQGYMSTPIVIDGHAYMHLRNQRFTCIDLKKGETCWTTADPYGKYWSMVAQKDRILALDERGILYLIKANPEKFELLDSREVSKQEAWAHLAVCGDEIYVRELKAITAYRWK